MTSNVTYQAAVSPALSTSAALRIKTSVRSGKATDDKLEPGGENIK